MDIGEPGSGEDSSKLRTTSSRALEMINIRLFESAKNTWECIREITIYKQVEDDINLAEVAKQLGLHTSCKVRLQQTKRNTQHVILDCN